MRIEEKHRDLAGIKPRLLADRRERRRLAGGSALIAGNDMAGLALAPRDLSAIIGVSGASRVRNHGCREHCRKTKNLQTVFHLHIRSPRAGSEIGMHRLLQLYV
jgi:hypothetical protein